MAEPAPPTTREERLAEQLRANLRRRKAQARELADQPVSDPLAGPDWLAHGDTPG